MYSAAEHEPPVESSAKTLEWISHSLEFLLLASLSVACFTSRWQAIRSRLLSLKSLVGEISDSTHWSENSLLVTLLQEIVSTLRRIENLYRQCCDGSAVRRGKLLMQSDLDMAAGWLSKHVNDFELLLRSGLLQQSTAIVLSRPEATSSREEVVFFIKDLFARLQIGGTVFKRKALESLLELLLKDEKSVILVAKDQNLGCLIPLLDMNSDCFIRELVVTAVSLLASAGDLPRKRVFEEGALGPLLRIIASGSIPMKEKAAMALEFITADPDNAWAISAYGGIPIIIELCKSGSLLAQLHAAGVIRNVSIGEDIGTALAEEGAVPVLIQLLTSKNPSLQGKAANCLSIIASGSDHFRSLLLQAKCLQKLLHIFQECTGFDALEHILRAIYSLSSSDTSYEILSRSTLFILRLADLVKHGNVVLKHISASLLANLAISNENKVAISDCMGHLVKLMESVKPDGMQEVAAKALIALLSVKSNRTQFVKNEKSMMKLMEMLNPKNEFAPKKLPVTVVAAIMTGDNHGCRRRLLEASASEHLQKLTELDIPGAKRLCNKSP